MQSVDKMESLVSATSKSLLLFSVMCFFACMHAECAILQKNMCIISVIVKYSDKNNSV